MGRDGTGWAGAERDRGGCTWVGGWQGGRGGRARERSRAGEEEERGGAVSRRAEAAASKAAALHRRAVPKSVQSAENDSGAQQRAWRALRLRGGKRATEVWGPEMLLESCTQ